MQFYKKSHQIISSFHIYNFFFFRSSESEVIDMLTRMSLNAQSAGSQNIEVKVPPSRHDIIHACDIIEDVAISIGYNNIVKALPDTSTVSNQVRCEYFQITYLKRLFNQFYAF